MIDELKQILSFSDVPLYNIKAVVQRTGVLTSTLRAWERRYGIPSPDRSEHGHRLYSSRDIAIIVWLHERLAEGMGIGHAVALLREAALHAATPPEERGLTGTAVDLTYVRDQLLAALRSYQLGRAHAIVNNALLICPVEEVVLTLFLPTLVELGTGWAENTDSVVTEHFGSNFIRQRIMTLFQVAAPKPPGPRIVCACVVGELHELGLLMFALLLHQRGWDTIYLGQSTPPDGLEACLRQVRPDAICLTASILGHVEPLAQTVRKIQGYALTPAPVIVYGGSVFDRLGSARSEIPGIYLGLDLAKAVDMICALVEQAHRATRAGHGAMTSHVRKIS